MRNSEFCETELYSLCGYYDGLDDGIVKMAREILKIVDSPEGIKQAIELTDEVCLDYVQPLSKTLIEMLPDNLRESNLKDGLKEILETYTAMLNVATMYFEDFPLLRKHTKVMARAFVLIAFYGKFGIIGYNLLVEVGLIKKIKVRRAEDYDVPEV